MAEVKQQSKRNIAARDMTYRAQGGGRTLQEVFDDDAVPPPASFRERPEMELGSADISIDRYVSQAWHEAEVDKVWRRTWQVACREEEIPEVGDYVVYDIVHDSVIVVRTGPDEIRAYFNACLHRGNALCLDAGHVEQFRCPYHGFTWSLDGKLRRIMSDWDFQHVPTEEFSLPQARVGRWGGFVFVNLDPDCESLEDYLEILPAHLDEWRFDARYIHLHVSMVVPCNWKVAQEAFIEGYHVAETHYQKEPDGNVDPDGIGAYTDDVMMQYDVWPESRHVTRMTLASAVPSQHVVHHRRSEQHIVDTMLRHLPESERPKLEPGEKARPVLAEFHRKMLGLSYGVDLSAHSDTGMLDQVQYTLFPNFTFWPTLFGPLLYRFRPAGDSADEAIMEVYLLYPVPEDGRPYQTARELVLPPGSSWSSVEELGGYGPILDQDTPNMVRMTKGLKTTRKPGVTLANYQEKRIRHFHRTLDEYLAAE
jgi:phenylpropionate dioxygenase-like ring-hydroxylating dioxygenase large terminal subunit